MKNKATAMRAFALVALLAIAGAGLAIPFAASAAAQGRSFAHTVPFATLNPGVPQQIELNQCDPALGVLESVHVDVSASTSLSWQAENESPGTSLGNEQWHSGGAHRRRPSTTT